MYPGRHHRLTDAIPPLGLFFLASSTPIQCFDGRDFARGVPRQSEVFGVHADTILSFILGFARIIFRPNPER
jgi:hypothetical protein